MNSQNPICQAAVPLLRTKLYPAHAEGAPLLERSALIERLLEAREQRLIVLSAPAGFGKSTVLSQLRRRLQEQGARVAWLSCDESDSEPARLLQYLVAA
ncbi:MAG: LuxR family transcriptional regulator, partial [Pseudomonas sp.]|nr:LuxR family transcriptional regulator [Pseudomonas sp.]